MEASMLTFDDVRNSVLVASLMAGLASSLVNGVTNVDRWQEASGGGCAHLAGTVVHSSLLIMRSMIVGLFAGMTAAMLTESAFEMTEGVMVSVAAIASFLADPVLRIIKQHSARIANVYLNKVPKDDGPGGSAQAGG